MLVHQSNTKFYFELFQNTDYPIKIELNESINLIVTNELQPYRKEIAELLKTYSNNIILFLEKLQETISNNTTAQNQSNLTHIYRTVLNEYCELRQFHINIFKSKLSADMSEIEVAVLDERHREHGLIIGVNYNCDKLFYIKSYDLPEFIEKYKFLPENSLISVYDKFVCEIESPQMQRFLNFMDEIDRNCWVLDPEKPLRKDIYRRIALRDNVSVTITYSSLDVTNMPTLRFLGPQRLVNVYEEKLNSNFGNWDCSNEPLQELMKLLGWFVCLKKVRLIDIDALF